MKIILSLFLAAILLSACGSSKGYLERTDEDKALQDVIKKLNKSASDNEAKAALPVLYSNILKTHQAKIKSYQTGTDLSRWDKILREYNDLQNAYSSIINSSPSFKIITPENFSTQLLEAKQDAAEDYYVTAENFLNKEGRENAKKAYGYFKKADKYIPGYKDVEVNINRAYENAIVNVLINPVQDNSYFQSSGWGSSGYDYSNEYFQRTLVTDLEYGNNNNNRNYAARFFTDWEARRENIQPDWVVDLRLRNMYLPQPSTSTYRQNRSADVQISSDTSGRPVYKKVYANLDISRMSFTAHADMVVAINEIRSNRIISNRSFREDYRWQEERASYSGDSRALNPEDWNLINNNNFNTPRREEILNELYRKIYPQVLNNIKYAVEW